jgi:fibronectin type 3 domain-containing protein/GH25 family lysozyme M1 (1,4-beta-N-acetylmuramidase)
VIFTSGRKWGAGLLLAAALCLSAPQNIHAATPTDGMDGVMGQSIEDETIYGSGQNLESRILKSSSRSATPSILGATSYTSSFLTNSFTTIGDFTGTTYYHKAEYEDLTLLNGIDVSWWQTVSKDSANYRKASAVNWEKVHDAGVDFAFVRVASRDTSGGTLYEDTCADSHIQGALANDINVGLYVFSQALTEDEAVEEAEYVIGLVDKYGWDVTMPIVMDREAGSYKRLTAGKLSKSKETSVIQAFADTVSDEGYSACVYASYTWFKNYVNTSSLDNCSLWIARYNNTTTSNSKSGTAYSDVAYDYEFWQYSSTAKVDGYSGSLDVNFWYKDTDEKTTALTADSSTVNSVSLSWSGVEGADGYRVYRYDESQSKYVYAGETDDTGFTDTGLASGTTYKYKVRCYWTIGGSNYYGTYSSVVTAVTEPAQVKSVTADESTETTISISWNSVANASGYRLYQYNDSTGSYQMLTDVGADVTSYQFSDLLTAKLYRYKVKAYILDGTTYYWGTASAECQGVTYPTVTTNLSAANKSATSITLKWDKVTRATSYQVYRLNTSTGEYARIATIKSGSTVTYTNTGLSSGKEYTYQVRACKTYDGVDYFGGFSEASAATTSPAQVTGLKATTSSRTVTLTWSKVTGATGYQVYRLNAKTKKYEKIATVKGAVTYKNTKLTKGTSYTYKVRAYRSYGGTTYYGSFSATKKITSK